MLLAYASAGILCIPDYIPQWRPQDADLIVTGYTEAQRRCARSGTLQRNDVRQDIGYRERELYQLSRPIIGVLTDAIIVLCHLSGHTSAALRCTQLRSNLASCGRPLRDVVWYAQDACGRPCGYREACIGCLGTLMSGRIGAGINL